MEGQGSFLDQILRLKQEIDELNVRIEVEIRETRELESGIVRCAEEEKEALKEEEELMSVCIGRESYYLDLCARSDALDKFTAQMEQDIGNLKVARDQLRKKIDQERDEFIDYCKSFQQRQERIVQAAAPSINIELRNRISFLEQEIETQKNLNTIRMQETERENADLQKQIDADRNHSNSLLADISSLKKALEDVEISRKRLESSTKLEAFEEEKRELQDCILALKSRIACLQGDKAFAVSHY